VKCFLVYNSDNSLLDAEPCGSIAEAKRRFVFTAEELARYGQEGTEAFIHLRDERQHDEPEMCADPSYFLSLGPRGGLKCEAT
jgi:hypothetical protein